MLPHVPAQLGMHRKKQSGPYSLFMPKQPLDGIRRDMDCVRFDTVVLSRVMPVVPVTLCILDVGNS